MASFGNLLGKIKSGLTDLVLGDLVRDWGEVSEQNKSFYTETLSLALYRDGTRLTLWLKILTRSRFSSNSWHLAMEVDDLSAFVNHAQSRFAQLQRLARSGRVIRPDPRDRLPFMLWLMLKAMFGVRASKLLGELPGGTNARPDYRIFGFVTRKSETRVMIQRGAGGSSQHGNVITSEGFGAMLDALAEYLAEGGVGAAEAVGSDKHI